MIGQNIYHILYTGMVSLLYEYACDALGFWGGKNIHHIPYIGMVSLLYEFSCGVLGSLTGETFITYFTLIRFVSSMNAQVTLQGRWLGKAFITYFALIRFLSCMNTHVIFQVPWLGKTFITYFTLTLPFLTIGMARRLTILYPGDRLITMVFRFCQSLTCVALSNFGTLGLFAVGLWILLVTMFLASSGSLSEAIGIVLTVFPSVPWNNSEMFKQHSNK